METTTTQAALTQRQIEITRWIAHGYDYQEIAVLMGLSMSTVKNHIAYALKRHDLRTREQLIIFALKEKLISLDEIELTLLPSKRRAQ
jgi:DNA-binding NarL/FixJ family response regulator